MSQRGGGSSRKKEEKAQRLRGSFRARSDADRRRLVKILRHEAHLLGIPVREDGWVSLRDLNYYVGTTTREDLEVLAGRDNKQRLVLYTDRETWIAAESGHSMSGVVGPGRELSAAEVPTLLVHGSYAEHTNSIYRYGLQARRAIHLLEIGSRHGRWRADLETAVFVKAQAAAAKGTRFLLTTNGLYLAPQGIAATFVEQILPWRSGPVPHLPITRMEALETAGQRAAARNEESRGTRNRAPAGASASSGYGVPGQEASAPAVDVGPFPTLSATEEVGGPSVARSAPGEGSMDTSEAAALPAAPATSAVAPPASSSELQPTVARFEPGEARASETEPSLEDIPWSEGARTLLPIIQELLSEGMPELHEMLGRLDCLGAAASMRHVREQGAYTKLHDTFHNPVGGGSAELAIGNWMLAFCGVLIEPSVASHWTGKNDDAPGSFVESWIVTLRQAGDANSRSLIEEFVRFGELAHRLVQPLCQVKQIYDLLDWRKGRRYCLSLLDQLASSSFAGSASSASAPAVARSARQGRGGGTGPLGR